MIIFWWIVNPLRWSVAFDSFFLPFLGFLFLPWTTLMYVLVSPGGVEGIDLLWIGLAVAADLASYAVGPSVDAGEFRDTAQTLDHRVDRPTEPRHG